MGGEARHGMITRDRIEDLLDEFDAGRVRAAMVALNWKWASSEEPDGIPSVAEIRKCARRLIRTLDELGTTLVGTGGLYAETYPDGPEGNIRLYFAVERVEWPD